MMYISYLPYLRKMSIIDHDLEGQESGNRELVSFKQTTTDVVEHRLGDGVDQDHTPDNAHKGDEWGIE